MGWANSFEVIPLLICLSILFSAGFLTVATEAFTHFAIRGGVWETFREFFLQTALFTLSASFWAATVWAGLYWLRGGVDLILLLEVLGGAHLPLLAYPLTIVPTIGYRLEQILRFSVYALFTGSLVVFTPVSTVTAALICLPGWLFHFLTHEARLVRRVEKDR